MEFFFALFLYGRLLRLHLDSYKIKIRTYIKSTLYLGCFTIAMIVCSFIKQVSDIFILGNLAIWIAIAGVYFEKMRRGFRNERNIDDGNKKTDKQDC